MKGSTLEEIADTIGRSAEGKPVLSPRVTKDVVQELGGELRRRERDEEQRRERRHRIERVLRSGRIGVALQPILELATGQVVGFEALARFAQEPPRPPNVWFEEAAEAGLGVELELLAVRSALAVRPMRRGSYLAINVSPETVLSNALGNALEGHEPTGLVLELTERARVEDYSALRASLCALREEGVRLAIDDVGAGFSSLHHVVQLCPDLVKLDRQLTHGVDRDGARSALAGSLISFAGTTGATIVAEGIETPEELEALRQLGVPCGQGYLLGRPELAERR